MTTNYDASDLYGDSDPYENFQTIDETPYPLSHGQFLGNLAGDVDFETIWKLGQGDNSALEEIDYDLQVKQKAKDIFEHLSEMDYWTEWDKKNASTSD
ncbi:MAG: hypothetical protein DSM106950_41455 [Stigonema ocellatum SAG 48.90 = DSM 106950]|nr:hypothetical protein [Stigonema ocellatum SAG 48.90 = DSM 106950]